MIGLFSCSKLDVENQMQENNLGNLQKSNSMLNLNNYAEFIQIWDTITTLDETSIINFLKQRYNFESFAEEADEFYDGIDWESFNTSEAVDSFIESHQMYFSITRDDEDETVIEPAVSNNIMRVFMNVDRLFRIGDSVFKVFENVTVGANFSDIQIFEELNESNIDKAIANGDVFIFSEQGNRMQLKDWAHNCGYQQTNDTINGAGNERVKLTITVAYLVVGGPVPSMNEWTHLSIKGYRKRLGIWFNVRRTITCDVKIATGYFFWYNYTWVRKIGTHATNGTFTRHLSKKLTNEWTAHGGAFAPISHFDGFNCWGKIPATPNAELKCNIHLVN